MCKSIVAASKTCYRLILDGFYLTLDAPLAIDSFSLTDVDLANFQLTVPYCYSTLKQVLGFKPFCLQVLHTTTEGIRTKLSFQAQAVYAVINL